MVAIGGIAFTSSAIAAACLMALVGFFGQIAEVTWSTLLQKFVPPHLLGRVTSTDWLVSLSLQPLGVALAVPVATSIGISAAFGWGAAVTAGVMAAAMAFPAVRATPAAAARPPSRVPVP